VSGHSVILFDACSTLLEVDTLRFEQRLAGSGWPVFGLRDAVWSVTTGTSHDATARTHDAGPSWLPALSSMLGVPVAVLAKTWEVEDANMNLWGRAIEGAASTLASLRERGLRLGVVSNADGRIEEALRLAGLDQYLDVVVDSAIVGVAKPDPRIFDHALGPLDVSPEDACYVGDSALFDVPAARGAGLAVWLIDHTGSLEHDRDEVVRTYPELLQHLVLGPSS
jgi:HAD superfamily hydrolase (TIGR01549 family)